MSEFKEALGKDKGALKGLTGALEELTQVGGGGRAAISKNDVSDRNTAAMNGGGNGSVDGNSVESKLALDVKEVAKRLSEQIDKQQLNNRQSKIPLQQVISITLLEQIEFKVNYCWKMHKVDKGAPNILNIGT